jgi:hypothetical protein
MAVSFLSRIGSSFCIGLLRAPLLSFEGVYPTGPPPVAKHLIETRVERIH